MAVTLSAQTTDAKVNEVTPALFCPARHHDLTACPICSWAATKTRIRQEAMR